MCVCAYMCVCIYIYIYVCVYLCLDVYNMYIHMCTVCVYEYIYVCLRIELKISNSAGDTAPAGNEIFSKAQLPYPEVIRLVARRGWTHSPAGCGKGLLPELARPIVGLHQGLSTAGCLAVL